MTQIEPTAPAVTGPLRTCIATGEEGTPARMIRFVVGPQGDVVPDLARRLPGRGMWVRAERRAIEHAVAKNLFAKSAKAAVRPAADLPERVERLLLERALADLGRARRAGRAVAGFVKVEQMIGRRQAGLLVIADEADGFELPNADLADDTGNFTVPLDVGASVTVKLAFAVADAHRDALRAAHVFQAVRVRHDALPVASLMAASASR